MNKPERLQDTKTEVPRWRIRILQVVFFFVFAALTFVSPFDRMSTDIIRGALSLFIEIKTVPTSLGALFFGVCGIGVSTFVVDFLTERRFGATLDELDNKPKD
jgi:hypothetical protein